jgi:hypothetical protein
VPDFASAHAQLDRPAGAGAVMVPMMLHGAKHSAKA